MTDNILEIDTTALAHVACAPQESGVLLTDFAAAYPSANHSWILSVIEKTELLDFNCRFPRNIHRDSTIYVEIAGATRKQFRMARGVRQGCLASVFLFRIGMRPDLQVASRGCYSVKSSQPGLLATCPMCLRRRPRCGCPVFSGLHDCAGTDVSIRGSYRWPQFKLSQMLLGSVRY